MRRPRRPAGAPIVEAQHHGNPLRVVAVADADPRRAIAANADVAKPGIVQATIIRHARRRPAHAVIGRLHAVQLRAVAVQHPDLAAAAADARRRFLGVRAPQRRQLHRCCRQGAVAAAPGQLVPPRSSTPSPQTAAPPPSWPPPSAAPAGRNRRRTAARRRRHVHIAVGEISSRMPEGRPPQQRIAGKGAAPLAPHRHRRQRVRMRSGSPAAPHSAHACPHPLTPSPSPLRVLSSSCPSWILSPFHSPIFGQAGAGPVSGITSPSNCRLYTSANSLHEARSLGAVLGRRESCRYRIRYACAAAARSRVRSAEGGSVVAVAAPRPCTVQSLR